MHHEASLRKLEAATAPIQPFQAVTLACGEKLASETITTHLLEGGQPVRLELLVSRPPGAGPFPTAVFNHGSTGRGDDPALFRRRWANTDVATHFVERGWMVMFPQRRGRGGSDGAYAEGLAPDGGGYDCTTAGALAGFARALEDLDAVMAHVRARNDVLGSRVLMAGQSRGGALSIAYAGEHPGMCIGAVNFAGGWLSDYWPDAGLVNTTVFRRGARFPRPTLWLYGENDPFYSLAHCSANFDAFQAAGGTGRFASFMVPGEDQGHSLLAHPDLWRGPVDAYLEALA